ncbi:MAG: ATPase, T2SS/T4P/T4SS family [Dehalococcoidia bacterium]|jgi:general secretion pathway protein E
MGTTVTQPLPSDASQGQVDGAPPEAATAARPKRLGEMLVDAGLLTVEQVGSLIEEARMENVRLGELLVTKGLVTQQDIAMVLSLQLNVPLIDLKRDRVNPQALPYVPEDYARRYTLVPLDVTADSIVVVMADPADIQVIEDLKARSRRLIVPAVATPDDIREAINLNYRVSGEIEEQIGQVAPVETEAADLRLSPDVVAETPIVRTVDLLIAQAVRDRASDIHLEPQSDHLRVRYRIDGILHDMLSLPLSAHGAVTSRIKVLAGMNIAERRRPQDGQFTAGVDAKQVDLRVASSDSAHGEMLVLRVLDKSLSLFDLGEVGFLPDVLDKYRHMLKAPLGMLLVAGPTGSGKTTTLYASVNQLDRNERNIVTIEDPIEYQFPGINQIQVNQQANITFATGLRSIMRLDPDVILVGEVRDIDTAKMATQAALTGHLVLSSIHANDAVGALFRLIDLDVEPFLITSALVGVVSQRMVRKLCPHCLIQTEPAADEAAAYLDELGETLGSVQRGGGCNFCANTGYWGRTGVFEVLLLDEDIRRLLLKGAGTTEIRMEALQKGMVTMRRDGMIKVREGITSPHEVMRNIYSIS